MVELNKFINHYVELGLSPELAAARVCQDIILKAISTTAFAENITIKVA